MKLQSTVLILYLCITLLVLVLIGGVLPATLHKQNLEAVSGDSINQLRHIDFALSNFIGEAKYDVLALSLNDVVQTRDDSHFTSFLNASEDTFQYSYTPQERAIIDILKDYQTTHPYVSSVYMGRENGAFVRSYPRKPTKYDPRDRPWYILAKTHPGQVSVTDPYKAVTTDDINIGIESPVLDQNGSMIGVVGADITLVNLTSYITTVGSVGGGEMILVDQHGTILASRNSSLLYSNISDVLGDQTPAFLTTKEGGLVLNGTYLMYYTSPELGWKIGTFVPFSTIEQKINDSIQRILLFVLLALVLLSVITLVALNYTVIRPLSSLTEVSRKIAETGDLDQTIETRGAGEIGSLARSFKAMVGRIHTDIEERRKAEEAQRESEEKYRVLFTQMTEGSALQEIVYGASGNPADYRILDVNPAFERTLGIRREDVVGKTSREAYGVDSPPYLDIYARIAATGQPEVFEVYFEPLKKHIAISAYSPGKGRFATIFEDITGRKQAEELRERLIKELEQKNAELERFTYMVSHDLKSPLITIKGFIGYLEQDARTGNVERLTEDITRISNAANRMQQLFNELMELSRIGRMMNAPEEVAFGELAREAEQMVAGRLTGRGVEVEIAPDLPVVYGDRTRLLEVLENLVENAVKFMGSQPHPRIEIGMRTDGGETVFFVRDNGIGIDPRYHKKIFSLFEKLDQKTEGTGIGLAIVRRIIEVHNGRIWVESDGEGYGSTFCFTLPDSRKLHTGRG